MKSAAHLVLWFVVASCSRSGAPGYRTAQVASQPHVGQLSAPATVELIDPVAVAALESTASVTFTVPEWPDRVFEARLVRVGPTATQASAQTTYEAVIELADPGHALQPGMVATVTFTLVAPNDSRARG